MSLGLWKIRYYYEWLQRDRAQLGITTAWRKHTNLLRSWDAPSLMPQAPQQSAGPAFHIHLLTGEFHFHLTCFCLYSLLEHCTCRLIPVIHDDGTLKQQQRREIERIFPQAQFVSVLEAAALLDQHLPRHQFPALRFMHDRLHLMRKLLDVHAGQTGPALFVDSDVLFYRHPAHLVEWLTNGRDPIYMLDYQDSYGTDPANIANILGHAPPSRVNTGLCGFYSPTIDWHRAEHLAAHLSGSIGINHFSEQTLTAMILSELQSRPAPPDAYIVSPTEAETHSPTAVMHHYVVPSRTWYYTRALPAFLKRLDAWPR